MKKVSILVIALLALFSCSKSSTSPEDTDEYYVKYEATNKTRYIGDVTEVSFNTDTGVKVVITGRTFSETFGPVKKGFVAKITCTNKSHYSDLLTASIYISKNGAPFALKAYKTSDDVGGNAPTATFTIDF